MSGDNRRGRIVLGSVCLALVAFAGISWSSLTLVWFNLFPGRQLHGSQWDMDYERGLDIPAGSVFSGMFPQWSFGDRGYRYSDGFCGVSPAGYRTRPSTLILHEGETDRWREYPIRFESRDLLRITLANGSHLWFNRQTPRSGPRVTPFASAGR